MRSDSPSLSKQGHLQPTDGNARLDKVRQVPFDKADKRIESLRIDAAHGAYMGAEMSAFDEPGQSELGHRGGMPVEEGTRDRHRLHELRRQHGIADPQARKERFGEGADIDRPVMLIESLHAGHRLPGIVEFAVVIVFDDPGLMPRGPLDQGQAPIERQRRAGRELMGGRQRNGFRLAWFGQDLFDDDPLRIHPDRDALQPGCVEPLACAIIGWVFHEDPVAGIE